MPEELAAARRRRPTREMFSGAARDARARPGRGDQRRRRAHARRGLEFFHAIGLPMAELWGMSETCGAGTVNPPDQHQDRHRRPADARRRAPAGRGRRGAGPRRVVMLGYRKLPEKTAEAIDADGWLHTGDIGAIDEDGYLKIVDRKKEIIINAAGKNMSPANIEATLKSASPLIGQAVVIGDGRPYNTALIVLDADFAPAWAAQHGLEGDLAGGAGRATTQVRAAVQEGVDAANAQLARVEQIKKFTIVARRLAARRRRADADDEAQAQADRREVRRRDRGALRGLRGAAGSGGRGARRARARHRPRRWPGRVPAEAGASERRCASRAGGGRCACAV